MTPDYLCYANHPAAASNRVKYPPSASKAELWIGAPLKKIALDITSHKQSRRVGSILILRKSSSRSRKFAVCHGFVHSDFWHEEYRRAFKSFDTDLK